MLQALKDFIDFFLHLDEHLAQMIADYGPWIYVILFCIIFVETGLVVMPLLPGDTLLFAAGTFAAIGDLNIFFLLALLFTAAVLGDTVNYHLGKHFGLKVLQWKIRGRQIVKQKYIDQTEKFYAKYGPRTIIIARFVPIVRTFAPFVAGIGRMEYKKFIIYNIVGGAIWVLLLTLAGYFFGTMPIVQKNFELVIFGIIFISLVPIFIEWLRARKKKS